MPDSPSIDLKQLITDNFASLDIGRVDFANEKGEVTWSYPAQKPKQGGCQRCHSDRVLGINAKCSDMCTVRIGNKERDGYFPYDMKPLGSGDYVETDICLDCGQVQGKFPIAKTALERGEKE